MIVCSVLKLIFLLKTSVCFLQTPLPDAGNTQLAFAASRHARAVYVALALLALLVLDRSTSADSTRNDETTVSVFFPF